ncbi:MAG: arginine deiminase family protein [Bacteroidia bacterium]
MKPRILSEYNKLKKVLIHTPGAEHRQLIPWEGDHPLMGPNPRAYHELQRNHRDLKAFLCREIGEENVLELRTLLSEIFENADYHLRVRILQDTLYEKADEYLDHLQARGIKLENYDTDELVCDLVEGYPRKLTLNNGRLPNIIIHPKREMMWMRDSSAVTPCGVVINSMESPRRLPEPTLIRSVFKYHPMFDEDTIFLDMVDFLRKLKEDNTWSGLRDKYLMEGGNILILSEEAIAVGVGRHEFLYSNRTTRPAFELLVKHLFEADKSNRLRRVYLVNVPDLRGFIHLDTVFNMFGPKSAICMPYIFGHPDPPGQETATEVLQHFVRWLRRNMGVNQTDLSRIPTTQHFEYAGKTEVYDRDYCRQKGQIIRLPQPAKYFLDQLAGDNLIDLNRIAWIGGDPEESITPYENLMDALFDQHNMAGNIFTTAPYRAITYHRNPVTADTLEQVMKELSSGAHLERMRSNEIRTDNGGPHCLTLPLLREE